MERTLSRRRYGGGTPDAVAPDVPFENNPDPDTQPAWHGDVPPLVIAERADTPP